MSSGNKGIAAVGMVLLDGIGVATERIAAWLGDLPTPAHVDAGRMASLRERLRLERAEVDWRPGGGVSNLARAAGAAGLPVEVWGCVGDDADGALIEASLRREGAFPRLVKSRLPTGVFCSLACGGARRIVVCQGAAPEIWRAALPEDAFRRGWALFIDGLLAAEPESMEALAARARAAGMSIAMDLSTPGNVAARRETLLRFAARHCDFVFANEEEFKIIRDAGGPDPAVKTAWVLKRGERGAALLRHGTLIEEEAGERLSLGDDTGAGDAFAAGFLAARLEGGDPRECLRRGNATALAALRNSLPNAWEFLRL
ncbi:carbohydrate kinase family protein [bacterium]|nr:carbohydrate kinase family protein [bacterium]